MKKIIYFSPFLYLLFLLARVEKALTQDLGRHIKLGEIIWSTHKIPQINLFSYTMPGAPFVNHHWLGEVLFYLLAKVGGVEAVIFWKVVLVMMTFGVMYFLARRVGSRFWAAIISVPYLYMFSYRFDARPEIFSFLYLSLFLLFIVLFEKRRSFWYLLLLLPIEVLWVNTHIYFFVGLLVYGAFVGAEFFSGKFDRRILALTLLLFLCIFVSPNGAAQALLPLRIFSNYGYSIVENQSVLFLNSWFFIPQVLVFEIVAALLLIGVLITFSKKYIFWYLVAVFGAVSGFVMVRNLPLFVILSYPLACIVAERLEKKYFSKSSRQILVTLLLVIVGIQVVRGVMSPVFGFFYIDTGREAVKFIEEKNLKGPIFNDFDIGSYLLYRLYPKERVFVDGRPEAYSVDFFEKYKRMQTDSEYFEGEVKKYNLQLIVFSRTDITPWAQSFMAYLAQQDRWVVAYEDNYYFIVVPRESENYRRINELRD